MHLSKYWLCTNGEIVTKRERLNIESLARIALSRLLKCDAISKRIAVGTNGPTHEFDIYDSGKVVGGITTGTHKTSAAKANTGTCDRACAELLWLSIWPGEELRIHVFTDKPLAEWLVKRFSGAPFPRTIDIYHYKPASDAVTHVGTVGAEQTIHSSRTRSVARLN